MLQALYWSLLCVCFNFQHLFVESSLCVMIISPTSCGVSCARSGGIPCAQQELGGWSRRDARCPSDLSASPLPTRWLSHRLARRLRRLLLSLLQPSLSEQQPGALLEIYEPDHIIPPLKTLQGFPFSSEKSKFSGWPSSPFSVGSACRAPAGPPGTRSS